MTALFVLAERIARQLSANPPDPAAVKALAEILRISEEEARRHIASHHKPVATSCVRQIELEQELEDEPESEED